MRQQSLVGQIRGFDGVFWICIFMELMERMAYYGVRLVVPVYMVLSTSEGGPGLSHGEKGTILAAWAAMQSWLPTFSGGFADRYGYKRTLAVSVFLKAGGYALMATADGFWGMMLGTQILAAGTGLFKPGIQGTMAHSITRGGSQSMGWGLFYQAVNVGAFIGAYIPAFTRDVWGWQSVFWACSIIVFLNLIPLFFYDDPKDERQKEADTRGFVQLVRESVVTLFTSPVLMGFVLISAGFWFAFHQFFDMLPNYVDDWTDSSGLKAGVGGLFGWQEWAASGAKGENIPQEQLLNLNAFLIMTTMFLFAWVSSRMRVLTSIVVGWGIATASLLLLVISPDVKWLLGAVALFTVGEMLSSPKKQEYMASLAPPGKRALYLGYANMPDGIGWVLGNLIAGGTYEIYGDKVNLARKFVAEHGSTDAARAWVADATAGLSPEAAKELAERAGAPSAGEAIAGLQALPPDAMADRLAEVMPRGQVLDFALQAVPTLPDGTAATAEALRNHLFATYEPGQVWYVFIGVGMASIVAMGFYDRWIRKRLPAEPAELSEAA